MGSDARYIFIGFPVLPTDNPYSRNKFLVLFSLVFYEQEMIVSMLVSTDFLSKI